MIIFNKYINNEDYTWYDSSNVVFSKCYDNQQDTKTLKVVFKNGRTYVYKDVSTGDYVCFKTAQSNGKAIHDFIIKKYKGVRITDTDTNKLDELKDKFINEEKEIVEQPISNLLYHIEANKDTGEFRLKMNGQTIYSGIENQVSIFNLFKSMNINYSYQTVDTFENESDELTEEIKLPIE